MVFVRVSRCVKITVSRVVSSCFHIGVYLIKEKPIAQTSQPGWAGLSGWDSVCCPAWHSESHATGSLSPGAGRSLPGFSEGF